MDSTLTVQRLIEIGLSKYEASAYLALLGHDDSTAVEVADRACVPRQRIYDVLTSLSDKGLIIISAGRPARHLARPPGIALPAMFQARLRAQAAENDRINRIVQQFISELDAAGNGSNGIIERVLRAAENIGGL